MGGGPKDLRNFVVAISPTLLYRSRLDLNGVACGALSIHQDYNWVVIIVSKGQIQSSDWINSIPFQDAVVQCPSARNALCSSIGWEYELCLGSQIVKWLFSYIQVPMHLRLLN